MPSLKYSCANAPRGMAVCEQDSGASDYIVHDETGFLAGTDREALDAIIALKNDPDLRARIGQRA